MAGPDLTVQSVTVNGRPAKFTFVQPTYPGDPNGQNDPDPRAHQAGQQNPVGGPTHNPLPPACAPELTGDTAERPGRQPCPANKLVITPSQPIATGATFMVTRRTTPDAPASTWTATARPRAGSGPTPRPVTAAS